MRWPCSASARAGSRWRRPRERGRSRVRQRRNHVATSSAWTCSRSSSESSASRSPRSTSSGPPSAAEGAPSPVGPCGAHPGCSVTRSDARDVEDHQVEMIDTWMLSVSTISGLGPGRVRLRSDRWILVRTVAGLSSTLFVGLIVSELGGARSELAAGAALARDARRGGPRRHRAPERGADERDDEEAAGEEACALLRTTAGWSPEAHATSRR